MKRKILFVCDWPDNVENKKVLQDLLDNEFSKNFDWNVWSCKKKQSNKLLYRWYCYIKGALYIIRNRKKYDAIFIWQQMVGFILFEILSIFHRKIDNIISFTIITDSNFLFRKYKKHFVKNALRQSKALIWPSLEMSNEAKISFPEFDNKNHFKVTPLFDVINIDFPVDKELDDPYFRDGIFTAGKSERDFDIVIRAFRHTDVPVTIVCPDEYPITETDITPNIRILRFSRVSHEQYYALAGQAFCILISVTNEKSPCGQLIVSFAMDNQKPIISTDCYGVRDFVVNNVNGILFKVGKHDEIFSGYEKLKNDKAFTNQLVKNAKSTAKEMSPGNFIEKVIEIIES